MELLQFNNNLLSLNKNVIFMTLLKRFFFPKFKFFLIVVLIFHSISILLI